MKSNTKSILQGIPHFYFCALFLLILFLSPSNAQNHEWAKWLYPLNNSNQDAGDIEDVVLDKQGNLYATGTFGSQITNGVDTLVPPYPGSDDIYLAKYRPDGTPVWIAAMGSRLSDTPNSLYVNDTSVFLASTIRGDTLKTYQQAYPISAKQFIVEFDTTGAFKKISNLFVDFAQWKNFQHANDTLYVASEEQIYQFENFPEINRTIEFSSNSFHTITDFHVTDDGEKVISGVFNNSFSYDDTTIVNDFIGTGIAAFIMKLDKNDSLRWIHSFGEIRVDNEFPLKFIPLSDGGYLIMTSYNSGFNFYEEVIAPENVGMHGFLARLDSSGEPVWHKSLVPSITNNGVFLRDLHVFDDNIFLAGQAAREFIYDQTDTIKNQKISAIFLLKTDPSGALIWSDLSGTNGTNKITKLIADDAGNFYAGGRTVGGRDPIFGCEVYPDTTGGLLFHFKDEQADELPLVDFDIYRQDTTWYFLSHIENGDSPIWYFGESPDTPVTAFSTTYNFSKKGLHNICLTAENQCGKQEVCKQIAISGLQNMDPNVSGSTNLFSGIINGVGFNESSEFTLVKEGNEEVPLSNIQLLDPYRVQFSVEFRDAPEGVWDLIHSGGEISDTLYNALRIEPNSLPEIEITVQGNPVTIKNRYFQYRLAVTNHSNINLPMVPLAVVAREYHDIIIQNKFLDDPITSDAVDDLGTRFLKDTLSNGEIIKTGFFAIPWLRAGETFYLDFAMLTEQSGDNNLKIFHAVSFLDEDYIDQLEISGSLKGIQATCFGSKCMDCLMSFTGFIPVVGCATGAYSFYCTVRDALEDNSITGGEIFDIGMGAVGTVLSCGGAGAAGKAAEKATKGIKQYLGAATSAGENAINTDGVAGSCGGGNCDMNDLVDFFWDALSSMDPNEKYGLKGLNEGNFIRPNQLLTYTILFENVDSATSPASEVFIYDTLDLSVYDTSTFQWTGFGFAEYNYQVPPGNKNYMRDIDLRETHNIILRFEGRLDSSGVVSATFTSLDTASYALTNNVFDGFLPPNVNSPEGEGYVSFAVQPNSGLQHATRLENEAIIIFDRNEPIVTGTWINTIDLESPTSRVNELPDVHSDTVLTVSWESNDNHSGIKGVDLFMAKNDEEYLRVMSNSTGGYAEVPVESGNTYHFYTMAKDHSGNTEFKASEAEASIFVDIPSAVKDYLADQGIKVFPNPARDFVQIELLRQHKAQGQLIIRNMLGNLQFSKEIRMQEGTNKFWIETDHLSPGNYLLQLIEEEYISTIRLSIMN